MFWFERLGAGYLFGNSLPLREMDGDGSLQLWADCMYTKERYCSLLKL